MKERRKRDVLSWSRFFWSTLFIIFSYVLFIGFSFSSFRLLLFGEKFHSKIISTWQRTPTFEILFSNSPVNLTISIREIIILPDQVLIFLKYPQLARLLSKEDIDCIYFLANSSSSSQSPIKQPPNQIDCDGLDNHIIRCPLNPQGFLISLALKSNGRQYIQPGPIHRWDSLVYETIIDRDNSTIIFMKGLNLRPNKLYNASRFECVYGWDFKNPKFVLRSKVISIAQEIVRCQTPLSILRNPLKVNNSIKVSIRIKGRGTLQSIARLTLQSKLNFELDPTLEKPHTMCICTMLRNQARFLKEWVMYHSKIGVERWFIYDNNSDDEIDNVIKHLMSANFNISRHVWPWIKTQEAGFAHCALRARGLCEWVGFIDVDEFFYLPNGLNLHEALRNQSKSNTTSNIAELRVSCHNFGPSGLTRIPLQGVIIGYTCRMGIRERHKSIVKPEALNSTLVNVVHHFHLSDGFSYVNVDIGILSINHYKYQVWEVFKEKFYRRVATYVADWQNEENVGSKDRAPGLGTKVVEPLDWPNRFCEVNDTRLKDQVLQDFMDPMTNLLPWQDEGFLDPNRRQMRRIKIKRL